jgi:transcriptional regulator
MYTPKHFEETRTEVMHAFIRQQPLGALVVPTAQGLTVEHVPFVIEATAPLGVLKAHVARANPVWQQALTAEAVVIFQVPGRYISPSWYPTKKETGKVVPTWNYVVVHAHGQLRFTEDPVWLRAHLEQLVDAHEGPRAAPWKITDAPEAYVDKMLGQIVGLELPIARLEGKWKLAQNRSDADRAGVVEGLLAEGDPAAAELARRMLALGE